MSGETSWRRRHPVLVAFGGVLVFNGICYAAVVAWLRIGPVAGIAGGVLGVAFFVSYIAWSRPAFFNGDGTWRAVP